MTQSGPDSGSRAQTAVTLFSWLSALAGAAGQPVRFAAGNHLITQYHPADEFFLLRGGRVEFRLQLDGAAALPVGTKSAAGLPVGWSGLRPPLRYPATVAALCEVTGWRWPLDRLREALTHHPERGLWLLRHCLQNARSLLTETRDLVCHTTRHGRPASQAAPMREVTEAPGRFQPLSFLHRAAFFDGFSTAQLRRMARMARLLHYRRGETLLRTGDPGPGLLLLLSGQVSLHGADHSGRQVFLRSLSLPGQVVAWTGVTADAANDVTVLATRPTQVYLLPADELTALLDGAAALQRQVLERLLWLVGNHLRSARAMLLSRQEAREVPAVRNLVEQSSPQLRVTSTLHKVPHLLEDRLTLGDAFSSLEHLQADGEGIEPQLAGLCLDLLLDTRREWDFFRGLQQIYDTIVNAPEEACSDRLRRLCAQAFAALFRDTPHLISGMEHLPERPGHIVVMNHLENHPFNTLPNGFQITLDSHFVTSMVLYRRYDDPGVRVVRYGRGAEYGHQRYYDRLGHIHVYTPDSGIADPQRTDASRTDFNDQASALLRGGRNLVICPEGSSGATACSPGPLKPGAFLLAARIDPEPLIVPMAVAHFDGRLGDAPFVVNIQPPFRVSDRVDTRNRDDLAGFLLDFRKELANQVRHASALGNIA